MTPTRATLLASITIVIWGLCAVISVFRSIGEIALVPLTIFYAILLLNSFFSIRLFSQIIPSHLIEQKLIDGTLFVFYIFLTFTFSTPIVFGYLITIFFVLAGTKYIMLLNKITDQPKLLKKKILVNSLGTLLGALTLGGMLYGFVVESAWALTIIFALANIYFLFINPLYKKDSVTDRIG